MTNTATAHATFGGADVASNPDSATVTAVQDKTLKLVKTATPTTYSIQGAVISYSFLVTNGGNVTLGGPFTVTDDKATDESCPSTASLAPGASIICTASYTIAAGDMTAGSVTNTAQAHGFFGTPATPVDSNYASATVTLVAQTGRIVPTQTTCQMFRDGTFTDLDLVQYLVQRGAIGSVNPGVFFYYSKVALPPGSSTIIVVPQQNSAGWKPFLPQDVNQIVLWNSACAKVPALATFDSQTGQVTVTTSATQGTYFLGVKYSTSTIVGQPLPTPPYPPYPTVQYGFSTVQNGSLLIHSYDSILVVPK